MANELELRKKIKESMNLLMATVSDNNASEEKYADFLVGLYGLNERIDSMFVQNEQGIYPTIDTNNFNEIMASYNDVMKKGQNFIDLPSKTESDLARCEIINYINDFLRKDTETLSKVDTVNSQKSLPELITESRTKTVDLTNQELKKTGAGTSVRLPFSYVDEKGEEISGFFTQETYYQNYAELKERDREEILKKFPEDGMVFIKERDNFEPVVVVQSVSYGKPGDPITENIRDKAINAITNNYPWGDNVTSEEKGRKIEELMKDDLFIKHYREYAAMTDAKYNDSYIRWINLDSVEGDRSDSRNSAMSIVANLIGCPDVIAHSEPMKIILDGREINGTFMKTADGKDITNIAEDDPLTNITYDQLNQTKPKKQMSDLIVLDYICGNMDRHAANLFYQTNEKGELTGIVGIDNDMSFPASFNKKESQSYGMSSVAFDNITAISSETANRILNLTDDTLKLALRGTGLNDKSIDVAVQHLNQVKNRIVRDIDYYKDKEPGVLEEKHLRVIDDFSKVELIQLACKDSDKKKEVIENPQNTNLAGKTINSPFGRLITVSNTAKKAIHPSAEKLSEQRQLPKGLKMASANNDESIKEGFVANPYSAHVTSMLKVLENADPMTVRSSTEFKAMKSCLSELDLELKNLVNTSGKEALIQVSNTYRDLLRLTDNYLNKKSKESKPSTTALKRMDVAAKIKLMASMHLDNLDRIADLQPDSLDVSNVKVFDFFDGIKIPEDNRDKYAVAFSDLRYQMEYFLTPIEDGSHPKLTEDNIASLKTGHENALKETERFLEEHEGQPDFVEKADLVYSIQKNLRRDYMALNSAKPGDNLFDKLSDANGRIIDVTGHEARNTGNMLSTRRALTITGPDGNIVKGFFTSRDYIGKAGYDKAAENLNRIYPEYTDDINRLKEEKIQYEYNMFNNIDTKAEDRNKVLSELENKNKGDVKYNEFLNNMKKVFNDVQTKNCNYMMIVDKTSSPIDTRNTAMSDIANMLGIGDVIAQSTEMKLKNGNEIIEGTFMVNAEGEDYAHLKSDNTFKDCKDNWLDYSPALKQMSDLNVLDYICMNTDRHNKNIIYRFDKSDAQNPKLVGITGIDNDMSFAPKYVETENTDRGNYNSGIEGMTCISDKLVKKIQSLDKSMIKSVLELRGLKKEHVEGVFYRLTNLKEAINKGAIPILTEEEFLKHKAEDFIKDRTENVFTQVIKAKKGLGSQRINNVPKKEDDVLNMYNKVDNLLVGQDTSLIGNLKESLEQATIGVRNGSEEFKKVQESIDLLYKVNKIMGDSPKTIDVNNVRKLRDGYANVMKCCMDYISRKEGQKKYFAPNTKDGRRIKAVRDVFRFCNNRKNTFTEITKEAEKHIQKQTVKQNTITKNPGKTVVDNGPVK